MSDLDDWENWNPEPVKPDLESLKKHAFPYREDPREKERKSKCIPATSRRFECPGCGMPKHVEPVFSGEEWHYFGQCSFCGVKWCNAYRLMIRCPDCGSKVPITSRNPAGVCKCQGDEVQRPF
jgi:hypothetical protein